jgi:hypothetical protein
MLHVHERNIMESITVSFGITLNTGNFESLRIDYGATLHVKPGETHEQAFDRVAEVVGKKFTEQVNETRDELRG